MTLPSDLDLLLQSADRQAIATLAVLAGNVGLQDERSRFTQALIRRIDASANTQLTPEEHALVGEAWKGVIELRGAACATLVEIPASHDPLLSGWRTELLQDLAQRADAWLSLLRGPSLDAARGQPALEVEQLTWIGDVETTLARLFPDAGHGERAAEAYARALDIARSKLPITHPVRLGLVLNYAICAWEILKEKDRARQLARDAFDQAISQLDQLDAASHELASAQLQRLWELLQAWAG